MLAAQRAREISSGSALTVERDNDKNPVVALREIADATVDTAQIEESLIRSLQKNGESDEPVEETVDMAAMQQEMTLQMSQASQASAEIEMGEDADLDEGELDAAEIEGEEAVGPEAGTAEDLGADQPGADDSAKEAEE